MENAEYFRAEMKSKGFDIPDGDAAIVPVMLYDAPLAQKMAEKLMDEGNLCHRVLLSCGSERKSENQGSAFSSTYKRTS